MQNLPAIRELAPQLAKLLGMLGSHHEGEVLNAARKAHEVVTRAHLTWAEVFEPLIVLPPPASIGGNYNEPGSLVDVLLDCPTVTDWESNFISSIARWIRRGQPLSEKQRDTLESIYDKHLGGGR